MTLTKHSRYQWALAIALGASLASTPSLAADSTSLQHLPGAEDAGFVQSPEQLTRSIIGQGSLGLRNIRAELVHRLDEQVPPAVPTDKLVSTGETEFAAVQVHDGCDAKAKKRC